MPRPLPAFPGVAATEQSATEGLQVAPWGLRERQQIESHPALACSKQSVTFYPFVLRFGQVHVKLDPKRV